MDNTSCTAWGRTTAAGRSKTEADLQRYGLTFEKLNPAQLEPGAARLDGNLIDRCRGADPLICISKALDLQINPVFKAYLHCLKKPIIPPSCEKWHPTTPASSSA